MHFASVVNDGQARQLLDGTVSVVSGGTSQKTSRNSVVWLPQPLHFGFEHSQRLCALFLRPFGRTQHSSGRATTTLAELYFFSSDTADHDSSSLPPSSFRPELKMLSSAFYTQGLFCTSHPWEVIAGILTLTLSMMSLTFFGDSTKSKICGWNFQCPEEEEVPSADIIILSVAHCLAAAYIYLQFRKMSALGSKYLLGLVGLLCIFFSISFSASFVHLLGYELHGLSDSLPFFLLLLDLSKVTALAKYALSSSNQSASIKETVARGVAILGPTLTLDTLVQVLVIGIGSVSGIPLLEVICCFGCVSLIVNYVVFMTFFPGSLCLLLELERSNQPTAWPRGKKYELESQPNPAEQRIKLIMSAGLALVHVYSRLANEVVDQTELEKALLSDQARQIIPNMPLWEFYFRELFSFSPQQIISFVFISGICVKYIFFDSVKDAGSTLASPTRTVAPSEDQCSRPGTDRRTITITSASSSEATLEEAPPARQRRFTVGDDDEVEEDFREVIQPCMLDREVQTDDESEVKRTEAPTTSFRRSLESCVNLLKTKKSGISELTDAEILLLVHSKRISAHKLEEELGDLVRAVKIRRLLVSSSLANTEALCDLPYENYDYSKVSGMCCENVIGYLPVPVGVAGPLLLDNKSYHVPLATTEGCLVASVNRGCRAITMSGGARSHVYADGMTRGPVVTMPSAVGACEVMEWITGDGYQRVAEAFNRTSRFARLQSITPKIAGRNLYIRFKATTGDAMGMNMLCKGTESALHAIQEQFPEMEIIALSGNYCMDKKPSALNWIDGRGKSVVCEAVITADVLRNILKTTVADLPDLNMRKNLIGSAMAGSIGGFNAHASNMVSAIFLATGQDIAQNVVSSNCITLMEATGDDLQDLLVSVTMPSIEVGTVGGGTSLPPQAASLQMLGVEGSSLLRAGTNAETLARVICGTVLAGELSLLSALAAGHLVQSHLKHNRSKVDISARSNPTSPTHTRAGSLQTTASLIPQCGNSR
ncbi:3-hydroxy-3-methylglutaryl-coenzyme A reductase [Hypsibius exemplaris]|uniref:3-hydroxy-3-methylglutaryl coenzyme A reductase n=1 Tax=Hypsibius exemplaris TaxID=2072580 RepID=A0A1W0W984_HYPEX|nr:3-hydroxy-3-methylglutaryl-coenzyme A reductase [Hypsibius exemplaris]